VVNSGLTFFATQRQTLNETTRREFSATSAIVCRAALRLLAITQPTPLAMPANMSHNRRRRHPKVHPGQSRLFVMETPHCARSMFDSRGEASAYADFGKPEPAARDPRTW